MGIKKQVAALVVTAATCIGLTYFAVHRPLEGHARHHPAFSWECSTCSKGLSQSIDAVVNPKDPKPE